MKPLLSIFLLALIGLQSALSQRCSPRDFLCSNRKCIRYYQRCDRIADCEGGEDEENCHPQLTALCPLGEFTCDGGLCIELERRCDGVIDCPAASDEIGCPCASNEFQCEDGNCIDASQKCNRVEDCNDGSDEKDCDKAYFKNETDSMEMCNKNEFDCGDVCIDQKYVCDLTEDCLSGADELNCLPERLCDFHCESDGACMGASARCDGFPQCADHSDEAGCIACNPPDFKCSNGTCIPANLKCNSRPDCPGGEDENLPECPGGGPACLDSEFACNSGQCIHAQFRCDGIPDCLDRSDEDERCRDRDACMVDDFYCLDTRKCIRSGQRCDGTRNCDDGSDEQNCQRSCTYKEWECSNGQCIEASQKCNGDRDCDDGSDEVGCPREPGRPGEPRCNPYSEFRCDDGECVSKAAQCNNIEDCRDGSDEINCIPNEIQLRTDPESQEISKGKEAVFQCRDEGPSRYRVNWVRGDGQPLPDGSRTLNNGARLEIPNVQLSATGAYVCEAVGAPRSAEGARKTVYLTVIQTIVNIPDTLPEYACRYDEATCYNRQCIPKNKVCDGYTDCTDGSDESRCSAHQACDPNMFMCDNRECIVKTWRCDNQKDCLDGSDEKNCNPYKNGTCYSTEFACRSGEQCIPRGMLCDKQKDCHDNSDEIGCKDPDIVMPPRAVVSLVVGETLILRCRAIGFPIPIINWRLNWGHVPEKCRQDSEDGLGTLTCPDMQIQDSGAYSCEAINGKSKFALPDANVIVRGIGPVCQPPTFNDLARSPEECIDCFCFGRSTDCRSANLYSYSLPAPRTTFPLVQVRFEPTIEISYGFSPVQNYTTSTENGFEIQSPIGGDGSQYIYYSMPEDTHGNQLKSYGGYINYKVTPGGDTRRPYIDIPDVVIQGNGRTITHKVRNPLVRDRENDVSVRIFEGEWSITNPSERQYNTHASRNDIMMVLENIESILIRAQYIEGPGIDAAITDINMDSATTTNTGRAKAAFVEECLCPRGYSGDSCERCSNGFIRQPGSYLGVCSEDVQPCLPGTYGDPRRNIPCRPCPCPLSNYPGGPATCDLGPANQPICHCPEGYIGERCERCDILNGFTGDARYPPGSPGGCRRSECSEAGSKSIYPLPNGACDCKHYTTGPRCDQCAKESFFLSPKNQYGCIKCFCMGITKDCRSSDILYRDSIETSFYSNSPQGITLVKKTDDQFEKIEPIVDPSARELYFDNFDTEVYYWALSPLYLFDKVTSYGGNLQYTIRYTPSPGGMSSKNSAADVEIRSFNRITLYHFSKQIIEPEQTVTVTVPLLEQHWQGEFGQETDREHLLQALADISGIYIKATYTTSTSRAALISVSLDTATERNTGRSKAVEVEDCQCLPGYTGTSCEDCAPGYKRTDDGLYLRLCEPCDCNGHSDDCEPETGECRNCRGNRAGASCEYCAAGYSLTPDNRCVRTESSCDERGTSRQYGDRCICKTNVEGVSCDTCRPGFFHLSADNSYGCSECYCSGVTTECQSSTLFMEEAPAAVLDNNHGFTLSDGSATVIRDGFKIYPGESGLGYRMGWRYGRRLFWSLPSSLTGDKVLSYGGNLKFAQRYSTNSADSEPTSDQDVIINGNGRSIFYTIDEPITPENLRESVVRISDVERKWRVLDQTAGNPLATREDILKVLSNVDHILVRASLASSIEETFIGSVSLETASQNREMTRADQIEVCRCPPEYRGTSCQNCVDNHYRDSDNTCKRCPCVNGRGCSLINYEVKCNCDPGWTGNLCDEQPRDEPTLTITMTPAGRLSYVEGRSEFFQCEFNSSIPGRVEIREEYSYRGVYGLAGEEKPFPERRVVSQYFGEASKYVRITGHLSSVDCVVLDDLDQIIGKTQAYIRVIQEPDDRVTDTPPSEPLIRLDISVSPEGYIPEGSRVTLTCIADTNTGEPPRIVWSKQGGRLPRVIDDNNGRLTIISAHPSDSGVYLCTANTRSRSETKSIIITVDVKDYPPDEKSAQQPSIRPSIKLLPSRTIEALEGGEIVIQCIASGYPLPEIEWYRTNGRSFNEEADISGGNIRIRNALISDEGEYECKASNSAGQTSLTVVVNVRADIAVGQLSISPRDINTVARQTITITCNLEPPSDSITLNWRRNDRREFPRRADVYNGQLTIRDIEFSDAGEYVCEAIKSSTGHKVSEASAFIRVRRGPSNRLTATVNPERVTVNEYDTAVMNCSSSVPDASISWTKVVNNRRSQLGRNAQVENNILRIVNAGFEDRALYVCRASFNGQFATARGFLEVRRRGIAPQIELSEKSLTLMEGESAHSECRPSGGSPPPRVEWSKGRGGPLPRNIIQEGNLIRFNAVQLQDVGDYVCYATNSAGQTTAVLRLDVQTRPRLRVEPRGTIRKTVGDRLQLICRATGVPAPAVHWEMQTRVESVQSRPETTSETGQAQVEIYSLSLSDAGYYTCRATSSAGQVEESVYVQVIDNDVNPPEAPQQVFEVDLYGSTEMTCSHPSRDPNVEYTWTRRDGRPLGRNVSTEGEQLIFHRAELSDSGDYVCEGKDRNGYPISSFIATLNVIERLDIRLTPEFQTVHPNDDAYIDCQVIGNRSADIRWEAVNRSLPRSATQAGGRISFKNIQVEDAGSYMCIAVDRLTLSTVTSMARVTVKPGYVDVSKPQPPPFFGKNTRRRTGKYLAAPKARKHHTPPCDSTEFMCQNGAYCIHLSKKCDGPSDCNDRSDEQGCDNNNFLDPPSVRVVGDRNLIRTEGTKLFLQCVVSDTPNVQIQWSREGSLLPTSADVRNGELMIHNLYPEDSGIYVCTARSNGQEASDSVSVRVEQGCPELGKISCNDGISCYVSSQICDGYNDCPDGEDEIMCSRRKRNHGALAERVYIEPSVDRIRVGETVDLRCYIVGVFVTEHPQWEKVGGGIDDNVSMKENVLMIHDITTDNAGLYRCWVKKPNGQIVEDTYRLEVQVDQTERPHSTFKRLAEKTKTVQVYGSVEIECDTGLEPPVNFIWTRRNGQLFANQTGSKIILSNVLPSDAGEYLCVASNSEVKIEFPTFLVVKGTIPRFTQQSVSFLKLKPMAGQSGYLKLDILLSIKPERPNGLIMYNGEGKSPGKDFIALGLRNGRVEFRFDVGSGEAVITSNITVPMGKWSNVTVKRERKEGRLWVNGIGPFIGTSPGRYQGLDLFEPMYLGSVPNYTAISPAAGFDTGFVGCISFLKINNRVEELSKALEKSDVSDCDTCSESSCRNNGVCQESPNERGFQCLCPRGFTGIDCQTTGGTSACYHGLCNEGRCVNTHSSYKCQCKLGTAGANCELKVKVNTPLFTGDSFLAYPIPAATSDFSLYLEAKFEDVRNSLLAYAGQNQNGHGDFISLTLRDQHIEFTVDTGSGPETIRNAHRVEPGAWLKITAEKKADELSLNVNGEVDDKILDARKSRTYKKGLNLLTPLYLGGYDEETVSLHPSIQIKDGITGCVKSLKINGRPPTHLIKNAIGSSNVGQCPGASFNEDLCGEQKCLNGGNCDYSDGIPVCVCTSDYGGTYCQIKTNQCGKDPNPCGSQGVCQPEKSVAEGYRCDCFFGFTGPTCQDRTSITTEISFRRESYVELPGHLTQQWVPDDPVSISMTIQTEESIGLVFWQGTDGQYMSIGVKDGYIEAEVDHNDNPLTIRSRGRVDDARPHNLTVTRKASDLEITLDGITVASTNGQPPRKMPSRESIFIGGLADPWSMTNGRWRETFVGCILQLRINDGEPLDFSKHHVSGRNVRSCLRIHDITTDNAGLYRRWVKKPKRQIVEDTYRLEVQVDQTERPHPTVKRLAEKTKTVQVYGSVEIECDTGLKPPVNFIWTRRNGQLFANQTGSRIILSNVLPSDAGEYLCVASNSEVKIEFPTFLVVKSTIPRFTQQSVSFLKLNPIARQSAEQSGYLKLDILLLIKPERPNGLIMYNGEGKSPGKDFIALGLRNGRVEFRFDVGSGEAVITSNITVPMGKWSNVTVKRERREGRLWVNGIGPFIGTSPGRYQGLDLFEPMYLGSVPNYTAISQAAGFDTGFVGCISFLKINDRIEELLKALENSGVSDCDTCSESSCRNNGVCQESPNERGFQCLCPRGFTGVDCQTTGGTSASYHVDQTERPHPTVIRLAEKTKTVQVYGSVEIECDTGLEPPVNFIWTRRNGQLFANQTGSRIILSNVLPSDAGEYLCVASNSEVKIEFPTFLVVKGTIPRFAQQSVSFLKLNPIARQSAEQSGYLKLVILLLIKPERPNGLIMYNGEGKSPGKDFIALGLRNGRVEFRFDIGSGEAVITSNITVPMGKWSNVTVKRERREGRLWVNGIGPFIGTSPGRYQGLDLFEPMYLGSVPNYTAISPAAGFDTGFVGCISFLKINNRVEELSKALEKSDVSDCDTCSESSCRNNGVCQESPNERGFQCLCPRGFTGVDCQTTGGTSASYHATTTTKPNKFDVERSTNTSN